VKQFAYAVAQKYMMVDEDVLDDANQSSQIKNATR
jgi:hypothetical protein